jgi:hypothetical protein
MSRNRRRPWDFDPNKVQSAKIAERDADETLEELQKLLKYRDHSIKTNPKYGTLWTGLEIYESLVPPEVSAALRTLQQFPDWNRSINKDDTPLLYLMKVSMDVAYAQIAKGDGDPRSHAHAQQFRLNLTKDLPCPKISWQDGILMYPDHPMHRLLMDYGEQISTVDKQNTETLSTSRELIHACNTWGQVRRLWPEVFTFLPANTGKVRVVNEQKQQSRLPPSLSEHPERLHALMMKRDMANRILTQAVLLKSMGNPPERLWAI